MEKTKLLTALIDECKALMCDVGNSEKSTLRYSQIWDSKLKPFMAALNVESYSCAIGETFLASLPQKKVIESSHLRRSNTFPFCLKPYGFLRPGNFFDTFQTVGQQWHKADVDRRKRVEYPIWDKSRKAAARFLTGQAKRHLPLARPAAPLWRKIPGREMQE